VQAIRIVSNSTILSIKMLNPERIIIGLKQVDFDGRFDYSEVVSCSVEEIESIRLLSQQVSDQVQIIAQKQHDLQIFDYLGKNIQNMVVREGFTQIDISTWPKGMYFLSDGFSFNKRFFKL
jgi:hypothetical protein